VNLEPVSPGYHALGEVLGHVSQPLGIANEEAHKLYATCAVHFVHLVEWKKKGRGENNRETKIRTPIFFGPARGKVTHTPTTRECFREGRVDWFFLHNGRTDFDAQSASTRIGIIQLDGRTTIDYHVFAEKVLNFRAFNSDNYYVPKYNHIVEAMCSKFSRISSVIDGIITNQYTEGAMILETGNVSNEAVSNHTNRCYSTVLKETMYRVNPEYVDTLVTHVMEGLKLHSSVRPMVESCFNRVYHETVDLGYASGTGEPRVKLSSCFDIVLEYFRSLEMKLFVCGEVSRDEVKQLQLPVLRGENYRVGVED
jgi:hypothetical protein